MRRMVMAFAIWMLASAAWADGRIEGRVAQEGAQTYLEGATVSIPALGLTTVTRTDGRFSFSQVAQGAYDCVVSYVGFADLSSTVTVTSGETTRADFSLSQTIEEIIVYGQAGSTAAALNQQRSADNITSVVSSDEFGQLPDANLSEALQRIPGVFLERDHGEGRFVGIRGIDPNLNVTAINGTMVPAPENDTRAVALDVIPTDLIETITVSKSFMPDMDPNGLGGSINVKSLSAFDRSGRFIKVRGEGSYNELEHATSPRMAATFSDTFDLAGGSENFGVALAVSWSDRNFGADNMETDGGWPDDLETVTSQTFRGAEEMEQRNYEVNRERLGAALNLDYRPSDHAQYYLRALFSKFSDQEYRTRNELKLDKGDAVSASSTSATWDDAELQRELKDRYEQQDILSLTIGGTHWSELWTIDWAYGYSDAQEEEPDRIDAEFEIEGVQLGYTSLGATPSVFAAPAVMDPDLYELGEITVEDNRTREDMHSFRVDFEREIYANRFSGSVKFGAKVLTRDKDNNQELAVYDGFPGDPSLAPFVRPAPDYDEGTFGPGISVSRLNAFVRDNRSSFDLDADDSLAGSVGGDYQISEDVEAVYAMAKQTFGATRLIYGLRYERTDFDSAGQRIVFDDVSGTGAPVPQQVSFDDSYDHLLASINLRHAFTDDLILRAAFYQTYARPSFGDLSPGGEIEFETDDGENELKAELGNPLLQPLEADHLELSLEYYDDSIGMMLAGVFYKELDNFVTLADVATSTDLTQFVGTAVVDDAEVLQPINGDSADLIGLELAWVKHWSSLPAPWNGLLTSFNATFTDGEAEIALRPDKIDLPRQSDRVFNAVIGYETERFSVRLAANYKSSALIALEEPDDALFDVYQDDHLQLDMSARFDIDKNWQVYFEAINLTDEPYYAYFGSSSYNAVYETFGRTYALGVQFKAL